MSRVRSIFLDAYTRWPQLHGALHVYALPSDELRAALTPLLEPIRAFDGCTPVEPQWMHATVSRLPAFVGLTEPAQITKYQSALAEFASATASFDLTLHGPIIEDVAVLVGGAETPQWAHIVDGVRGLGADIFGGTTRRTHAPHISLGYGTADADSAPLAAAYPDERSFAFPVRALSLLAVVKDPIAGTFTWDVVGEHLLGH